MMNEIHICHCGCRGAAECPLPLICTSSSCHWRLVEIRYRRLDDTALTSMQCAQLCRCRLMEADFPETS
jgi:hypothetical protein